ncbi:hypothetical protein B7463_g12297, partial [Scytalidium lignicola]
MPQELEVWICAFGGPHISKNVVSSDNAADEAATLADLDDKFGMKILVDKPSDLADLSDIIAIHGLNGHYYDTWSATTSSGVTVNWLQDFLPAHIPNSKILSYSYNSVVQFSKSLSGIDEFADQLLEDLLSWRLSRFEKERPIALNRAHERDRYSSLLSQIKGVFFFGTPHRGTNLAQWAALLENILKVSSLGTSSNARLMKELQSRSEILSKISKSFVERGKSLTIFTFYETEMMPYMNCKPDQQTYRNVWTNLANMISPLMDCPLTKEELAHRQTFYTTDYELQKKLNDLAVVGTCRWFLNHDDYLSWYHGNSSKLLWVSAGAGCGKSQRLIANDQGLYATFFFKDDNEEQNDSIHAISAFLHQIYTIQPALLRHAIQEQSKKGNVASKSFTSLWNIFKATVTDTEANDIICFIDGLDECNKPSRQLLIDALAEIFATSRSSQCLLQNSCLKILVTSRPENVIKISFQRLSTIRLKGEDEIEHITHDIELVVQAHIDELKLCGLSTEVLETIQQQLIQGADRTFLWITLIIHLLKDAATRGASERDLHDILASRDIYEVYDKLLANSSSPDEARRMLHIIIAAARPMTLDEMSVAMCFKPRQNLELSSNLKIIPGSIRHHWFGGNDVENHTDPALESDGLNGLKHEIKYPFDNYLVHQTARAFLLHSTSTNGILEEIVIERKFLKPQRISGPVKENSPWRQSISMTKAHSVMLEICATHIWLFGLPGEVSLREQMGQTYSDFCDKDIVRKFRDYSARYWPTHGRHVQNFYPQFSRELCNPRHPSFDIWIAKHPSFKANFPGVMYIKEPQTDDETNTVMAFFHLKDWIRDMMTSGLPLAQLEKYSLSSSSEELDVGGSASLSSNDLPSKLTHREKHDHRVEIRNFYGDPDPIFNSSMSNPTSISSRPMLHLARNLNTTRKRV